MDKQSAISPLLLSPREAARVLSISPRTLWTLTNVREIRAIRVGRLVRYSPDELRAWIERRKGGAES